MFREILSSQIAQTFKKKIKNFISKDPEIVKEKIEEQTFINWINHYLEQKNEKIVKIEDIIDSTKWKTLFEILWNEKINYELNNNLSIKERKKENFNQLIQYLRGKGFDVSSFQLIEIIPKKDKVKIIKSIVWQIISKFSIDWISYYGLRGKEALLHWCNTYTNENFKNYTESWKNGETICEILQNFHPKEIDINSIEPKNDPKTMINYAFYCLQNYKVPIFIPEDSSDLDEKSIIIQYSVLFDCISKDSLLNPQINFNNNNNENKIINNDDNQKAYNYYNPNCNHSIYDPPDFYSGIINPSDLNDLIQNENHIIKKINEKFKTIMEPRYPVQIAYIMKDNDELKIIYEYEKFEDVIKRAGQRPIIFVSCIGRYQQGKSTLISGITGNIGYAIGNKNKETTKGVYIDGPYNIDYLYKRFNIQMRKDMYFGGNELLSPLIFFFDIEGYDGIMHGNDIEKNNNAFIEMCTPFLCLSSIFLFLSEPNTSLNEINTFLERMKVSNLTTYSNNDDSNGALQLHIIFNRYNDILNLEAINQKIF